MTTNTSARALARRNLVGVKDQVRLERRARDERIERAALDVGTALVQRDQAELRAGQAIEALYAERLSASEVSAWCGGLSASEIRRLRQVAKGAPSSSGATDDARTAS